MPIAKPQVFPWFMFWGTISLFHNSVSPCIQMRPLFHDQPLSWWVHDRSWRCYRPIAYYTCHLRAYLAALPTNPPECSQRVWSRNGREGCSGMLHDIITQMVDYNSCWSDLQFKPTTTMNNNGKKRKRRLSFSECRVFQQVKPVSLGFSFHWCKSPGEQIMARCCCPKFLKREFTQRSTTTFNHVEKRVFKGHFSVILDGCWLLYHSATMLSRRSSCQFSRN